MVALLAEGVDRNIGRALFVGEIILSPSSRRAWIEIPASGRGRTWAGVALLAEGVDRNIYGTGNAATVYVALLAEGVDRNFVAPMPM